MLGRDKRRARAPRETETLRNSTTHGSAMAHSAPVDCPPLSHPEPSPPTAFFRQFSAQGTGSEGGLMSSTSAPPSRDMWGVGAAVPRRSNGPSHAGPLPPFYEDSLESQGGAGGGSHHRLSAERQGATQNVSPRSRIEATTTTTTTTTETAPAPGARPHAPPAPLYASARAAPPSFQSLPSADPFQSLQWCESPSLTELRQPGFHHHATGLPNLGSLSTEVTMAGPEGRTMLASSLEALPLPDSALDVPAPKLQAVINAFLFQRFRAMGGSAQASRFMEPERQLMQDLMCHHFFQQEAQRQAHWPEPPPQQQQQQLPPPPSQAQPAPPLSVAAIPSPSTDLGPTSVERESSTPGLTTPPVATPSSLQAEQHLRRRYRHQRFGRVMPWDLVFPFWRGTPPLTVEVVSPSARRRVEQWRWEALVLDAALAYTPAVLEEPVGSDWADHTPFVADPFARLNGRARECPALPMTRRTAWDPQRTAAPPTTEPAATAWAILQRKQRAARALDGASSMACLRQSLLIDQGVRQHRVLRAEGAEWRPLLYPLPFLPESRDDHNNLRAALLTEDTGGLLARVHVEALSAKNLLTTLAPSSPPPVCLITDPTATGTTGTAENAGDSATPLGHSIGVGRHPGETNGNLSASLTALFSGYVSVPSAGVKDEADGNGAERRRANPSTEYLAWAQWASALRHPLLASPFRSLVVEDVSGTCHLFCGRPSPAPSSAMLMWLRHRHTARQAPWLAAPHPLTVRKRRQGRRQTSPASLEDGAVQSLSGTDEDEDDQDADDYVLCPPPRSPPPGGVRAPTAASDSTASQPLPVDDAELTWMEDAAMSLTSATTRTSLTSSASATFSTFSHDDDSSRRTDRVSLDRAAVSGEAAPLVAVGQYRLALMLEEWKAKRAGVVRRMDTKDPPWRMLGARFGAAPRPLALHLTDAQLPWLATQLCPDQDGLLDLQELHLALAYESVFRRETMHAWLWVKAALIHRPNLLVVRLHFALEPGALGTGLDTDEDEPNAPAGTDSAAGPTGSVLVGGIALPARTVARVSARVSARSLSSTSSTAGVTGSGSGTGRAGSTSHPGGDYQQHSSQPPVLLASRATTAQAMTQSAPSPPLATHDSDSQSVSPALAPQPGLLGSGHTPPPPSMLSPPLRATIIHSPPPPPPPHTAPVLAESQTEEAVARAVVPVAHVYHRPPRPHSRPASPRPASPLPAADAAAAAEMLARLSQPRPVVGVCSTVPQPEDDPAVLREVLLRGLEFVPSLQVLHVQNGPMEVLRSLFRETRQQHHHYYYGNMAQSPYAALMPPPPKPGLNPEMVSPLREIFFSAEQHPRARREAVMLEVTVHRFPVLEVLWVDAPRVHHIYFIPLTPTTPLQVPAVPTMPLRELHLLLDASFSTSTLAGIEAVPTLEVLHLERVVVNTLGFLGASRSLRELLLHACRFISPTVSENGTPMAHPLLGVEKASALETLSLAYTNDAKTVDNFADCPSLRRLILTRCNGISSASLVGLEKLPRLTEMALEFTRVSNLGVFATSPSLRVLRLCGCKRVLRMSILDLERSPNLSELYLNDTNVVTVANLGCGSSFIRVLDLSGCRHLDDSGLQGLQGLAHLEVLTLSHTPVSRVEFLQDCPALTTLYLECCPRLAPDGVRGLEHLPRLQRLVATGCANLETVGFLGASASLLVLSLAGCGALTSEGLMGIERCASLRYLHVADTAVSGVGFLAGGARRLQCLNLSGCAQLTSPGLHGVEKLPALVDLYLERLSSKVNDVSFLVVSRSLRRISLRDSTGVSVYARRELARGKGIIIEH